MSTSENDFKISSDEAREMSYADAMRFKLPQRFSHWGRRLGVVARSSSGRGYLKYILDWKELPDDTVAAIKIVLEHYDKERKVAIEEVWDLMHLHAIERDPETVPTFTLEEATAKYEADMKKKEEKRDLAIEVVANIKIMLQHYDKELEEREKKKDLAIQLVSDIEYLMHDVKKSQKKRKSRTEE